jgi:hypothetical protein
VEQKYSIEQVLNAKINQKAQKVIGELSAKLFEAEAKAELLQELYNDSQTELQELKGQASIEKTESQLSNRALRRQKQREKQKYPQEKK